MSSIFAISALHKIRASILDLLRQGFHEPCCLCNRSADDGFCGDCWRQVQACQVFQPLPTTAALPPLVSWGCYEGSLKRAIAQMKYHNRPAIALRLGEELGLRWLQLFPIQKSFQVVPVPLHQVRLAERGYNQAEQIARGFCRVVGVSCRPHGLVRRYQTQAQHTLSPQSRAVNLRGAFSIGPKLNRSEKPVLLLDDIFTTGATVAEAQQALNRAGFSVLGSAVVAQARLF